MNLRFNYLDNILKISDESVHCLEIENRGYFYRCISDFVKISNGDVLEDIYCFDNENQEISLSNRVSTIFDYFNFETIFKRYTVNLNKYIINNSDDITKDKLAKDYKKIKLNIMKYFSKLDLPISINEEFNFDLILKLLKPKIDCNYSLLNNLLTLIELEKIFQVNKLLIFVNLKQLLNKEELIELYKYSLYNKVKILLIDAQSYGPTLDYEKKIIIDSNLDEIMI